MDHSKEKLINSLFDLKVSKKSNLDFTFNDGYDKQDLVEATKTLISRNLTMGKKLKSLKNFCKKNWS